MVGCVGYDLRTFIHTWRLLACRTCACSAVMLCITYKALGKHLLNATPPACASIVAGHVICALAMHMHRAHIIFTQPLSLSKLEVQSLTLCWAFCATFVQVFIKLLTKLSPEVLENGPDIQLSKAFASRYLHRGTKAFVSRHQDICISVCTQAMDLHQGMYFKAFAQRHVLEPWSSCIHVGYASCLGCAPVLLCSTLSDLLFVVSLTVRAFAAVLLRFASMPCPSGALCWLCCCAAPQVPKQDCHRRCCMPWLHLAQRQHM